MSETRVNRNRETEGSLGEADMAVQLICCSHSPLMVTGIEESPKQDVHAQFFNELNECVVGLARFPSRSRRRVRTGSFQRLLLRADAGVLHRHRRRRHQGLASGKRAAAGAARTRASCVRFLQSRDFDVAISHQMKVDHGITIPLFKLTGALARYDVLPIFVNCAADPRPSFRRVRRFGEAIGEFLADKDLRVTIVGSGGLSHDPPTPRFEMSPPDVARRLIVRQTPTQEELDARENRVIQAARDLAGRQGPLPAAERAMGSRFPPHVPRRQARGLRPDDRRRDRSRCGLRRARGPHLGRGRRGGAQDRQAAPELRYYHLVPEWITGMAIVVAQ